jgi:hypothetical protein
LLGAIDELSCVVEPHHDANKLRDIADTDPIHDRSAIILDRPVIDVERRGDLFACEAFHHEIEHLPMAVGKLSHAGRQGLVGNHIAAFLAGKMDRGSDACIQPLNIDRLAQEVCDPSLHRLNRNVDLAVSSEQDQRHHAAHLPEPLLEIQASHTGHADVGRNAVERRPMFQLAENGRAIPEAPNRETAVTQLLRCLEEERWFIIDKSNAVLRGHARSYRIALALVERLTAECMIARAGRLIKD